VATRARRLLARAPWALLALTGAALLAAWPSGFPLSEREEVRVKALLGLGVLALLLLAEIPQPARRRRTLHLLAGAAGVLAWMNFGAFFHGRFVNRHEFFHYFLGSKYFPELGYDGLYVASAAAQLERDLAFPVAPRIRDLRTGGVTSLAAARAHQAEVLARFTPERWEAFVEDHHDFVLAYHPMLDRLRVDYGYNPTPAWTFVGRLFSARLPARAGVLAALVGLDLLLLAGMFGLIRRSYGSRVLALSLAIFGLGYAWRFYYTGGAFLRMDWLAASVSAVCLLERRRPAAAGALLGYATAVRVFPALLLLGPGVVALRELAQGRRPGWVLRLGGGFVLAVGLAGLAGSLTGRGPAAWSEFAAKIELHRGAWTPNRVGFDTALESAPALLHAPRAPAIRIPADGELLPLAPAGLGLKAGLLALLLLAMWRATAAQAALLGLGAIWLATPVGCYYLALLLAVPLRRGRLAPYAILALGAALYAIHPLYQPPVVYGWMSLALTLGLAAWILPNALRTVRQAWVEHRDHQPSRGLG
jgi:hypothetical protein